MPSRIANLKELAQGAVARLGYEVRRVPDAAQLRRTHPDLPREFAGPLAASLPISMTSVERLYALWQAVEHVERHAVAGDIVEAGVWRGGSSVLAARALLHHGNRERDLWLYDTFEGMSEPTEKDVATLMAATDYPGDRVNYVRGKVEDTIPAEVPERMALLRLDTDWYESTRHELEHLWDRLEPGGVLIIDDYGHWAGAREAVDEFFAGRADAPLLSRIDYTGRIGIKR